MNLLDTFFKNAKVETDIKSTTIESLFNTNNIYISEQTVEKIPVVAESIETICSSIAQLPLYLYQENIDMKIERLNEDKREFLLNQEVNNIDTAFKFKYELVKDLLLYGKHYSFIERENLKIKSLNRVNPRTVVEQEIVNENGIIQSININYTLNNKVLQSDDYNFLIIKKGKGILNSSSLLELILHHDRVLEKAFKNAVFPSGVLQSKGRLTKDVITRLRESWAKLYSGSENSGKTVILEEGLEFKSIDINTNHIQMLDNKKLFIEDVQRLFNLHQIKDNNDFLKRISPYLSCIENSLDKSLLLETEKEDNYFFNFNVSEINKTSEKERMEVISMGLKNGIFTLNEARAELNRNSYCEDDDDFLLLSLGNVLLKKDCTITIPNLGVQFDIDNINNNPATQNHNDNANSKKLLGDFSKDNSIQNNADTKSAKNNSLGNIDKNDLDK